MDDDVVKGCFGVNVPAPCVDVYGVDLSDEDSVQDAVDRCMGRTSPCVICAVCFETDKGSFAPMNNLGRLIKTGMAVRPICVSDRWDRAAEVKRQAATLFRCVNEGLSDKGFREFGVLLKEFLTEGGLIFTAELSMDRPLSVLMEKLFRNAGRGVFLGCADEGCNMGDYTRRVELLRDMFSKRANVKCAHGFYPADNSAAHFFVAAGGFDKQTEIEYTEFVLA